MNRILSYFILITVILSFAACSEYNKAIKSDDYKFKYEVGMNLYEDEDYYKAITLFDEILHIYRGTGKAEKLGYVYADCHFMEGDFIMGAYFFDKFTSTYPYSDSTESAMYKASYCYYLNSPRASLDQQNTLKALASFQTFINKYPETKYKTDVNKYVSELRDKLEKKSYMSSKLYYKLGDFQAAAITLKNSLKDFPDSEFREELMYLAVKSSYYLAEASVEARKGERYQNTISEYYSFIDEFPESEYLKEIEKMYAQSVNNIKKL